MAGSVVVGGARTPIGKMSGGLASLSGPDLGGIAITGALASAGIAPDQVDYVIMGEVLQAGVGQIPSRQAAVAAGIPMTIPSNTINKVCLSGLHAIYLADQMVAAGDADIVVAGGMESMTNAPYLLPKGRSGYRYGNAEMLDAIVHDGLFCAFDACLMGAGTERYSRAAEISRSRQDEIAAASHERAAAAQKDGRLEAEIVPVEVPQRRGGPIVVDTDEGVRPGTTAESLAGLRGAFESDGTITAGNASQLSDGASAVIVMSPAKAAELGVETLFTVAGYGQVAGPDPSLLTQPSRAIAQALDRSGRSASDVALYEINEAFAAVAAASIDDLGVSEDVVNVNGGAIALGHPIGMSGNRLALTLAHELRRRGGGLGAAALCGGGGQGDALLLEV
ncbi:MAG: acetyl-CoA C-acyltransferase [Actinomycetota bacterium]